MDACFPAHLPSQDRLAPLSSFWKPWLPMVYSCAPSWAWPLCKTISSPWLRSPKGLPIPKDWWMWSCKVLSLPEMRRVLEGRSSSRTSCSVSYRLCGNCITGQLLTASSVSLTNSPVNLNTSVSESVAKLRQDS